MPSRSTRRRQHKAQGRAAALPREARRAEAARLLVEWHAEARRRAGRLGGPSAWAVPTPAVEAKARAADPSGELLAELRRLIAEAVAGAAGGGLLGEGVRREQLRRRGAAAEHP